MKHFICGLSSQIRGSCVLQSPAYSATGQGSVCLVQWGPQCPSENKQARGGGWSLSPTVSGRNLLILGAEVSGRGSC